MSPLLTKLEHFVITPQNLTRLLVGMVLVLSLAAGFFHAGWTGEHTKYLKLEDKYVRVRDQLGTEKTQELIDQSHLQQKDQTDW